MSWFILSILSVFAQATAELTQQRLLNRENPLNPRASAVLTFLFQSILITPILLLFTKFRTDFLSVFDPDVFPRIIVVTLVGSAGMVFYLKSFQVKNISFSTIFVSFSAVVSTVLGIVFLGETVYPLKFVGIFLVLVAIVSLNFRNGSLERNHLYGLLAGLLFGITYTLDKNITQTIHPVVYLFWAFITVAFWGFLFNPRSVIESIKGKSLGVFKAVCISGIGYLVYNLLTFTAYTFGGEVGRVDTINNFQIFLIILFEYFILKHTENLARKLITALIALAGIIILGLY